MKDKTALLAPIVALFGQGAADAAWQNLVQGYCGGHEPASTEAFEGLTLERMERYGIPPAIATKLAREFSPPVPAAQGAATPPPPDGKKGRYKAGKIYTALELAQFAATEPKGSSLFADVTAITQGEGWLVRVAGKVVVEQTARYIQWHLDGATPPKTVKVEGVPVAPVLPSEVDDEQEQWIDPHDPQGCLDVTMVSPRTDADFSSYVKVAPDGTVLDDTPLSAMIFLYEKKLSGEGDLALKEHAEKNAGKTAAEILAPWSTLAAAWSRLKPAQRPSTRRAKRLPFVDPPREPARGGARRAGLEGGGATDSPSLDPVFDAIVATGVSREALLLGIDRRFLTSLPLFNKRTEQIKGDLDAVRQAVFGDGTRPYRTYLKNAAQLTAGRLEAEVFLQALRAVPPDGPSPARPAPTKTILALGTTEKAYRDAEAHLGALHHLATLVPGQPPPGHAREPWLAQAGASATVVVLFVSVRTLHDHGIQLAVQAARDAGTPVIPVTAGACDLEGTPFAGARMVPDNGIFSGDGDGANLAVVVKDMLRRR